MLTRKPLGGIISAMNDLNFFLAGRWELIPILVWTLFWKGYSLWVAAKANQNKWFIALLVLNTFGILDIIYIFFVAKKRWEDIKAIFTRTSSPNL